MGWTRGSSAGMDGADGDGPRPTRGCRGMLGRRVLAGAAGVVIAAAIGVAELFAALPKDRTIAFTNIHTKETISVQYAKGGKHVPEAMEKINWILRDWRRDEATRMDPDLIDLIWEMHTELGSAEPVHIISGYRSRTTNEMLRKTVGGQASDSRHILGKAADVYFPDVPLRRLRYSALIRERGGVGYYPTSATPFVHVDTDRVRHWPRLPRFELALLFPSGRTQHQPADGGPITTDDVKIARAKHQDLAVQVAEYISTRRDPATAFAVADVSKSAPRNQQVAALTPPPTPASVAKAPTAPAVRLVAEPRLVDRPTRLVQRPGEDDRNKLAQLAALASIPQLVSAPQPAVRPPRPSAALPSITGPAPAVDLPLPAVASAQEPRVATIGPDMAPGSTLSDAGRFGWGTGWVRAPEFDDEHPEELSYRPFPITPYLTETASPHDPALVELRHPDVSKTLEMLDQAGSAPPMKLRPGQQVAQILWAQQFRGSAVASDALSRLVSDGVEDSTTGISDRRVRTSQR